MVETKKGNFKEEKGRSVSTKTPLKTERGSEKLKKEVNSAFLGFFYLFIFVINNFLKIPKNI